MLKNITFALWYDITLVKISHIILNYLLELEVDLSNVTVTENAFYEMMRRQTYLKAHRE